MQSQFLWSANMQNNNKVIIEDNENDKTELLISHYN